MMVEGSSSLHDSSPTKIIENVLYSVKQDESELTIVHLETSKETGMSTDVTGEVSGDRGLEIEDCESVKADGGDEEVPQVGDEKRKSTQVPKSPEVP